MKISTLKLNPNNPRIIKDDKFEKLVKSITDFPAMMEKRPIVCVTDSDGKLYPLGGNMRLKAIKEIGYKEIPDSWVMIADEWSEEQRKEFVIKDNVGFGEWDFEDLKLNWDTDLLATWGLDMPEQIENSKDGEIIDMGIKQSIQVIPKNEYIIITEPENSKEWEELKTIFKCGTVRSGGCKIGSSSDKVGLGIERVFNLKTFKERVGL